jgi:hypothetical protein
MKALLASITILAIAGCSVFQEDTSGLVELVEKAVANKAEWQGKEVTVYGYVSQYRPPPEGTDKSLHLTPSPAAISSRPQGSAIDSHVEATAEIGESIQRGMVARRILDGIVRNVYKSNTGKTAAWTSASHIEKSPKKKDTPTA